MSAVRECRCGHPEGDHKWNRSATNPGHGVCLTAGCACREFVGQAAELRERHERAAHSKRYSEPGTEHQDERGVYYVTEGGQRYHYEWCHDCGGEGCDYCEGDGQVRVDE